MIPPEKKCGCLKQLDELRLDHEEAKISGFFVVQWIASREAGKFDISSWGHLVGLEEYVSIIQEVGKRMKDALEEERQP